MNKKNLINCCIVLGFLVVGVVSAINGSKWYRESEATNSANGKKKLPIYSVEVEEKKVAISFDAAWGADDTEELLRILGENDVKATFFLCGYWIDDYTEEVKRIAEEGHELGNHGMNHAHGAQLNLEKNKEEINQVSERLESITGIKPNLFRPPFGEYNNTVLEAAEQLGYYTIQWDVDSHDWMEKGIDYEIDRVLNNKNLKEGSIVLFHNDAKYTPQTLDRIIKGLKEKGYELVPIGELIHKEDYKIDFSGRQIKN